jgi:hypothetical protein
LPFVILTEEEFIGHTIVNCAGAGGWETSFQGSSITLGQIADAGL